MAIFAQNSAGTARQPVCKRPVVYVCLFALLLSIVPARDSDADDDSWVTIDTSGFQSGIDDFKTEYEGVLDNIGTEVQGFTDGAADFTNDLISNIPDPDTMISGFEDITGDLPDMTGIANDIQGITEGFDDTISGITDSLPDAADFEEFADTYNNLAGDLQETIDWGKEGVQDVMDYISDNPISDELVEQYGELKSLLDEGTTEALAEAKELLGSDTFEQLSEITDYLSELDNITAALGVIGNLPAALEGDIIAMFSMLQDLAQLAGMADILDAYTDQLLEALGIDFGTGSLCPSCPAGGCIVDAHLGVILKSYTEHSSTQRKFSAEEQAFKAYVLTSLWAGEVLPSLMKMTMQAVVDVTLQTFMIGSQIDARIQIGHQRKVFSHTAQSSLDYTPDEDVCTIATSVRSLAASEDKAEFAVIPLVQATLSRLLMLGDDPAAPGPAADRENRHATYTEKFCSPYENNSQMRSVCPEGAGADSKWDADYARWGTAGTVPVDFSGEDEEGEDGEAVPTAETAAFEFMKNMFGDDLPARLSAEDLKDETNQIRLIEERSLIAKRMVAATSGAHYLAMRSAGTEKSAEYLEPIYTALGVSEEDAEMRLHGEEGDTPPSYFAQMETLTRTVYQNPDFFTGLTTLRPRLLQKEVAMKAIGVMQEMDHFDCELRSEMLFALLLEMALIEAQERIESEEDA